jgi:hypothetical protein
MSITAISASHDSDATACTGCEGAKGAPLATFVNIGRAEQIVLCEECGRDLANAVGFMCIRTGGWSKLEPRKRPVSRAAKLKAKSA